MGLKSTTEPVEPRVRLRSTSPPQSCLGGGPVLRFTFTPVLTSTTSLRGSRYRSPRHTHLSGGSGVLSSRSSHVTVGPSLFHTRLRSFRYPHTDKFQNPRVGGGVIQVLRHVPDFLGRSQHSTVHLNLTLTERIPTDIDIKPSAIVQTKVSECRLCLNGVPFSTELRVCID